MYAIRRFLYLLVPSLAIASCGGGGGGGGADGDGGPMATASALRIDSIAIAGTTAMPATVSVNGIPDADARIDRSWRTVLHTDGHSLPVYQDGRPYSATITTNVTEATPATTAFTIEIEP